MTTYTKDRTDYRQMELSALVDEAKYGINIDWRELAVVLAERAEKGNYQAEVVNDYCPYCDHEL